MQFLLLQIIMLSTFLNGLQESVISKRHLIDQASHVRRKLQLQTGEPFPPTPNELYFPSSYKQSYGQRGFCNWLIPGHVMIGQYPGQTPESHGPKASEVERHVDGIVTDARIRMFCSLQSEVPRQDDYSAWNDVGGSRGVQLPIGGGREDFPGYFTHYAPLVKDALKKTHSSAQDSEDTFVHAPILDLNTPSSASLLSLLSTILDGLQEEKGAIYIHCWGGRGRAGLVGACLLSLVFPELDAKDCLQWVQRGYDTRAGAMFMPFGLRKSPQTAGQRDFVSNFVQDSIDAL